jgi:hypothetical protein
MYQQSPRLHRARAARRWTAPSRWRRPGRVHGRSADQIARSRQVIGAGAAVPAPEPSWDSRSTRSAPSRRHCRAPSPIARRAVGRAIGSSRHSRPTENHGKNTACRKARHTGGGNPGTHGIVIRRRGGRLSPRIALPCSLGVYSEHAGRSTSNKARHSWAHVGPMPLDRRGSQHPKVKNGTSWLTKHPFHPQLPFAHVSVALCLFGVPGVAQGKAGLLHTSTAALSGAAQSHVSFLARSVEDQGSVFSIYSHSWNVSAVVDVPAILATTYGRRLRQILHQRLEVLNHVTSIVRSMTRSLLLARDDAADKLEHHDIILLMRHATYWVQPLDLCLDPTVLTVATWVQAGSKETSTPTPCVEPHSLDGVADLWFAGPPSMLEYVFGTLLLR